jgi:hypothetical protein
MKRKSNVRKGILLGALGCLLASPLFAVEIITKEDIVNNVIKKEQLVKVADNAIFLLDTSSSSNDEFNKTGKPIVQVMKSELQARNSYFPDIGHNIGVYTFTDWQENLAVQLYNRDKVAAGLDTIRDKGRGPTPLKSGLLKLDDVLKPLSGRTAVFVFWDGEYTGDNPANVARNLVKKYDVCFYVVTARNRKGITLTKDVATLSLFSGDSIADFFTHRIRPGAVPRVKSRNMVTSTTPS